MPFIKELISPNIVFGYMSQESNVHTPKFVQKKKNKLDDTPARVPDSILLTFKLLKILIARMGRRKPVQVNRKIFELPINKSDNATVPKINKNVDFLFK
jgi:hypothetical protein